MLVERTEEVTRAEVTEIIDPNEIRVIRILNPFNPRERVYDTLTWAPGNTVRDYFPLGVVQSVVSVNGKIVPEDQWGVTYLARGDNLVVCPVPQGGGGNGDKQILSMIAMVVVMVVAPYAAGALNTALGMGLTAGSAGMTALTMAVTMAGSMLVNSLIAPSKPNTLGDGSGTTYGIDGPKNTSEEGVSVPVCYGEFRVGGNVVGLYTEDDGDNQVLYMLINAGEGPIGTITDIMINDQPVANYGGVEYQTRMGTSAQSVIPWFSDTIVPQNKNLKLSTTWATYTTTDDVDKLRLDLVAPGGLFLVDPDDGSTYATHVDVQIQYRKQGTTDWLPMTFENVLLYKRRCVNSAGDGSGTWTYQDNGQPVSADDLAYIKANYNNTDGTAETSTFMISVADVPVYGNNVYRMEAKQRTTVRRAVTTPQLERAIYDVRINRTTAESTDGSAVDVVYLADINEIQLEPLAYPNTALLAVKIKLNDQINGLPAVTYKVAGRLIDVYGTPSGSTTPQWYQAVSSNPAWIVWDMLTHTRYGAAMPTARLDFASFKRWADHCDQEGLTFNGVFNSETNVWDATQYVLRCGHAQLVNVGTRFGVVIEMPDVPVMMFSVANMVKDSYKETWLPMTDRANDIDVTFFDKSDGYKQRTVKVYEPTAITAGRPQRSSAITLYGVVDVDQAYKEGQFQLNLNKYLLKTITFSAPLEAIACTAGDLIYVQHDMPAWAQAGRFEAGSTASVLNLDRPVTMEAGKNYKVLVVQSDVERCSGNITSINGNTVFLSNFDGTASVKRLISGSSDCAIQEIYNGSVVVDDASSLVAGAPYGAHDTDVIEEANVVLVAGDQTQITLQAPLSAAPAQFQNWMFGEVDKIKQIFRIKAITASTDHVREITAIQYDERIFDTSRFPSATAPVPNPANAQITQAQYLEVYEETRIVNSTLTSDVVATWVSPSSGLYAGADIYVARNGGDFVLQNSVTNRTTAMISAARGESITVKVVAFDLAGNRAPLDAAPSVTYKVLGEVPNIDVGQVTGAMIVWNGKDCRVSWRYNSVTHAYEFGNEPDSLGADAGALDPHFKDYEIRVYDASAGNKLRRVEYAAGNTYTYTYEKNLEDGAVTRDLRVEIRMRDVFNNLGDPAILTADNPPPQVTGLGANPTYDAVGLAWTLAPDADFAGTMLWLSTDPANLQDITSDVAAQFLVYDGPDSTCTVYGLMFDTVYYVRAAGYDVFGKIDLTPTPVISFKTPTFDVNAIADGVIGESKLDSALQTKVNANSDNSTAIIEQGQEIDGLNAQYTVKIDANGYVVGYGLASTTVNSVPTSEFAIRADKFSMQMPSYPGVYPFTIGPVNGVPKVILSSALIGDATIGTAAIGDATITNAKIGSELYSSNWSGQGGNGWRIAKDGAFVINNIYARGDIQATSLTASVVNTTNVAGAAITTAVSASGTTSASCSITVPDGASSLVCLFDPGTYNTGGGDIAAGSMSLSRDGTTISSSGDHPGFKMITLQNPTAGTYTFTGTGDNASWRTSNVQISMLVTKR